MPVLGLSRAPLRVIPRVVRLARAGSAAAEPGLLFLYLKGPLMIKEALITHTNKRHAGPKRRRSQRWAGICRVAIWEVSMAASTGSATELLPVLVHCRYQCSSKLGLDGALPKPNMRSLIISSITEKNS